MANDPMWPGASDLGDTPHKLFSPGAALQQSINSEETSLHKAYYLNSAQNQGVNYSPLQSGKANVAGENSPQYGNEKNRPTATEDPQEVEARWTARMAKFAGIAQATGVKI